MSKTIITEFKSNIRTCLMCSETEKLIKVSTGTTWRYLDSTGHKWNGKLHVRCYNKTVAYKNMKREQIQKNKQVKLTTKAQTEAAKAYAVALKQGKKEYTSMVRRLKKTKTFTHFEVYGVEQCYNTKWGYRGEVLWQCSSYGKYSSGYCLDCRVSRSIEDNGIVKPVRTGRFRDQVEARTDGAYLYNMEPIGIDLIDGGIC